MGWVARFAESYKRNKNQLCVFVTTEPVSLEEISGPRYQVSARKAENFSCNCVNGASSMTLEVVQCLGSEACG